MRTCRRRAAITAALLFVVGCSGNDTDGSKPPAVGSADDGTTTTTTSLPSTTVPTAATAATTTTVPPAPTSTTQTSTTPATREPTAPSGGADWSPIDVESGRWMAFVSHRTGAGELFVIDLDTAEERRLTAFGGSDTIYQLTWSPDGSAIAFQCPSDLPPDDADAGLGPSDICVFDVVTGGFVNVTADVDADQTPAWSPDSSELAFFTFGESGPQVRVAERGGTSKRVVAEGGAPTWSPDGTELAVNEPTGTIAAVDPVSGERRLIAGSVAPGGRAAWSPDGTELAFECLTEGADPDVFPTPTDLCIVAADGTGARVLADAATTDSSPIWSPDGSAIAFTATEWSGFGATPGEIRVVPAVGGNTRRIATGTAPAWSPDGSALAIAPAEGGVALVDVRTGEITTIVIDPTAGEFTWAPTVVSAG